MRRPCHFRNVNITVPIFVELQLVDKSVAQLETKLKIKLKKISVSKGSGKQQPLAPPPPHPIRNWAQCLIINYATSNFDTMYQILYLSNDIVIVLTENLYQIYILFFFSFVYIKIKYIGTKKNWKTQRNTNRYKESRINVGFFTRFFRLQVTVQLYISQAILYLVYLSYKGIKVKFNLRLPYYENVYIYCMF